MLLVKQVFFLVILMARAPIDCASHSLCSSSTAMTCMSIFMSTCTLVQLNIRALQPTRAGAKIRCARNVTPRE